MINLFGIADLLSL